MVFNPIILDGITSLIFLLQIEKSDIFYTAISLAGIPSKIVNRKRLHYSVIYFLFFMVL